MPEKDDTDREFELHLEEYRALRDEISTLQRQRFTTAQVGIAGIVATWSFLVSLDPCKTHEAFAVLGWLIPVFIALGCSRLTKHASLGIRHGAAYLAMIEEHYSHSELGGWHNRSARINAAKARANNDQSCPALLKLKDYPAAKNTDINAIFEVLLERSESPRPSDTLGKIWPRIFKITVVALLIAALIVAVETHTCSTLDARIFPASANFIRE